MGFPFPSTALFYVFGLFNSWSRLSIFGLNELERSATNPSTVVLNITVSRPNFLFKNFQEFVNDPETYQKQSNIVFISICDGIQRFLEQYPKIDLEFEWKFYQKNKNIRIKTIFNKNCSFVWKAPFQGQFTVSVTGKPPDYTEQLFQGFQEFKVVDYWIVAIGDSFASGEGNPDKNLIFHQKVQWINESCHRSKNSWANFIFEKLERFSRNIPTHFTYLACSGASVDNGILNGIDGNPSQIDIIEKIAKIRQKGPDLLLMSVGGNDVGYSDILGRLLFGKGKSLFNSIEMRLFYLAHELERLGEKIQTLNPNQVIIPYYFDITRNFKGFYDSNCPDLKQIGDNNLKLADRQIMKRVNKIIFDKSKMFNWTVIERVPYLFRNGGVCSSHSLVRNSLESIKLQGDTSGALHPNEFAHLQIADLVWKKLNFKALLRV